MICYLLRYQKEQTFILIKFIFLPVVINFANRIELCHILSQNWPDSQKRRPTRLIVVFTNKLIVLKDHEKSLFFTIFLRRDQNVFIFYDFTVIVVAICSQSKLQSESWVLNIQNWFSIINRIKNKKTSRKVGQS